MLPHQAVALVPVVFTQLSLANLHNTTRLVFAHAMWRHGERTATVTFPNDPVQAVNWTMGEGGFGILTPKGMEQHYQLGKLLRRRYIDSGFLSRQYKGGEVEVHSTVLSRALSSAQSNMAGMYSSSASEDLKDVAYPSKEWPGSLQPVPVRILDNKMFAAAMDTGECPRMDQLLELVKQSIEYRRFAESPKVDWLLRELSRVTNFTVTLDLLVVIHEAASTEPDYFPSELASWCPPELRKAIIEVYAEVEDFSWGNRIYTPVNGHNIKFEISRLVGGPFLRWIVDSAKKTFDGRSTHKYQVHSGHDQTMAGFLNAFGVKELLYSGRPDYASCILIEFRIDNIGKKYFELLWHDNSTNGFYSITKLIPECSSELCSFETIEMLARRFDVNIEKACPILLT